MKTIFVMKMNVAKYSAGTLPQVECCLLLNCGVSLTAADRSGGMEEHLAALGTLRSLLNLV